MTRCTYFSIQCDTPSADLALTVQKIYVSALIMIISGIIYCPVDGSDKFDYPENIEKIFDLPSFFSNAILRKQELIFKTKNPFLILFFYHMLTVITLRGLKQLCGSLEQKIFTIPSQRIGPVLSA
jgi:hypothetical protein